MKVLVVLSCVLALGATKPTALLHTAFPLAYTAPVVPVSVSSQYHAQDNIGQYSYGYADGLSSKAESRSLDGITRGAYSYVDAEGKLQSVHYTADDVNGFQVAATNLPVAPLAPVVKTIDVPKPVEDTPEVAKAKEEHFAAVEEVKARLAADPVEVLNYVAPVTAYAAPLTSFAAPGAYYTSPAYPYYYNPYGPTFGYYPTYPSYPTYPQFAVTAPLVPGHVPAAAPAAPAPPPLAESTPVDEDTVEVKAEEI